MRKFLVLLLIMFFTFSSLSMAEEWDTVDKYLLAGLIVVQTIDCLQTNYIFEHSDQFHETNSIITKKSIVPLYFITFTLLESLIAHKLDSKGRKIWLSACILNSSAYAINNMVLGIGFSF